MRAAERRRPLSRGQDLPGGGLCPEWQQPPQTIEFAGVVVAGISSPGVFRRNATAGLPVNGIYPLIPIQ